MGQSTVFSRGALNHCLGSINVSCLQLTSLMLRMTSTFSSSFWPTPSSSGAVLLLLLLVPEVEASEPTTAAV
jgi:hypothetical protein